MSANTQQEILIRELAEVGILPLFYHDDPSVCIAVTKALYEAGVRYIEFTNRGPRALVNFKLLVNEKANSLPGLQLGVGTIKTATEARSFLEAGADFLVSPIIDEEIAIASRDAGVAWIPGCMTPTEIFNAERLGCPLVKLFPGNVLGVGFVDAIKVLFPSTRFIVTGGVDANKESIYSWLDAGVIAVGLGSKLITNEVLNKKDMDQLKERTGAVLKMIQERKKVEDGR